MVGDSPSWVLSLKFGEDAVSILREFSRYQKKNHSLFVKGIFPGPAHLQYMVEKPGKIQIYLRNTAGNYTGTLVNSYQEKGIYILEGILQKNNELFNTTGVYYLTIKGNGIFIK